MKEEGLIYKSCLRIFNFWDLGLSYGLSKFSDDFTPFFRLWKTITKGSSQNFARRGQTKELSYRGEGVWTRFVVRSTVKKEKWPDRQWSALWCLQSQISKKSVRGRCLISKAEGACMRKRSISRYRLSFWRPGWRRKHSLQFDTE